MIKIEIKFAERLKELRTERELTQEKFAKEINIARGTISTYEIGRHEPDLKTLAIIARFFKVTTDYLLGLED